MHKEVLKSMRNIVDIMPYLHSDVHNMFQFYPSKTVMREKDALFNKKVSMFKFPQEEVKAETTQNAGSFSEINYTLL